MTMLTEWRNGHESTSLPSTVFVAFPGVGNVGKVALTSIRNIESTVEVARLHPVGLPPLAELDEDGLLSPPHYSLASTTTSNGTSFLTLIGKGQPNEPGQQSSLAREMMEFFQSNGINQIIVLAGLISKPEDKLIFAVASSSSHRIDLEAMGVDVRRDEPKNGAIGLAALLASMGPLYDLNSACIITSSVGNSEDTMGAQRKLERLNEWFDLGLTLPNDGSDWLKERLNALAPGPKEDLVKELTSSHDAFYM